MCIHLYGQTTVVIIQYEIDIDTLNIYHSDFFAMFTALTTQASDWLNLSYIGITTHVHVHLTHTKEHHNEYTYLYVQCHTDLKQCKHIDS